MEHEDAWDWDYVTDLEDGMDLKHAAVLLAMLVLCGGWLWFGSTEPKREELKRPYVIFQWQSENQPAPTGESLSQQAWSENGI